jgi:hypothetical protein
VTGPVIVHRCDRGSLGPSSAAASRVGRRATTAAATLVTRSRRRPLSPVGVALAVRVPLLLLHDLIVFVSHNLFEMRLEKAVFLLQPALADPTPGIKSVLPAIL